MPNHWPFSTCLSHNGLPRQTVNLAGIFLLLTGGVHAQAAINVSVVGATPTQVILQYTSAVDGPCSVEASESASYRPLVHDVDPSLFPQADLDSRPKNLTDGRARVVVVGSRISDTASDQNVYSR